MNYFFFYLFIFSNDSGIIFNFHFFSSSKLINQATLFILYFIQIYRVVNLSWFILQRHNYFISSFLSFPPPPFPSFFTLIKQPSSREPQTFRNVKHSRFNLFLRSFLLSSTPLITTYRTFSEHSEKSIFITNAHVS